MDAENGASSAESRAEPADGSIGSSQSFQAFRPYTTVSQPASESPDSSGKPNDIPRLVTRNLSFHQSKNKVQVAHNKGWSVFNLKRHDWFHVLLRQPTNISLLVLIGVWTAMIIVFAGVYVAVDRQNADKNCGLSSEGTRFGFGPAFAFSLETCTTVGYGLPNGTNSFFERRCGSLVIIIYLQMVWSMMFNAFLFAFFYNRLGRCETRAVQVVMANKAIVNMSPESQVRFQVRIFDVDAKHPVVEAHIRFYAVHKARPVPRLLRLLQPNDELGAYLFLSLPTVVSHHIDIYSLLHPPVEAPMTPFGIDLRQVDSAIGSREEIICPICSESFGTHERWTRHVRYQKIVESHDQFPTEHTHLSLTEADLQPPLYPLKNIDELRQYFKEELSEIICVVEGIDPLMSGTFQALQSYRYEDIVWQDDAGYAPCLQLDKKELTVNLDRFHEIERTSKARPVLHRAQLRSLRYHDSLYDDKPNPESE
ncbi:hypothetical protein ACA910_004916 [Epithemia clementina (nom. ined.)]